MIKNIELLEKQLVENYKTELINFLKQLPKKRYYIGYEDNYCKFPEIDIDDSVVIAIKLDKNDNLILFTDLFDDGLSDKDVFFENNTLEKDDCAWYDLTKTVDYIDLRHIGVDELIVLRKLYKTLENPINDVKVKLYKRLGDTINETKVEEDNSIENNKIEHIDIIL